MNLRKIGFLAVTVVLLVGFILSVLPGTTEAGCTWSVGRYKSGSSIKSNPLPTKQCTWFVDGKTDRNGWDLVFSKGSGRDAYKWYRDNLIINANRGTIGYPGDIMVFKKSDTISGFDSGHVAYVTGRGYWNGKRAWTVRHSNWPDSYGQTTVETICGVPIKQCTFVETSPGYVKIQNGTVLGPTAFPFYGFLYKK